MARGYLHTRGAEIVDAGGQPVRLAGVNWYGLECTGTVPGGLDHRSIDDICAETAALGFNTIRLPFSVQAIRENPTLDRYLDAEPALQGKQVLAVMDAVIDAAGRHDLMVILDSHRSTPGWSLQRNGLWYNRQVQESAWIQTWETLVQRYAGNPTMIGCDLHNEPGSPPPDPSAWPANGGAVWGYGDSLFGGRQRDWAAAATRAGNRILGINPDLLIFVEGVRSDPAGPAENHGNYWFGGNLTGVRSPALPHRPTPVRIALEVPDRLVYSVHDYGPAMAPQLPWCRQGDTAESSLACNDVWDRTWGFITQEGIAPVLVGEFGTPNGRHARDIMPQRCYTQVNESNPQGNWFAYLVEYISQHRLHWTYWCLNGTQSEAPGRRPGTPEGYGVLDQTWTQVASDPLMEQLQHIQ